MKESIIEIIEDLGTEMIKCRQKCKGVKRCQDEGYYPQPFFLDSEDTKHIDVIIVGENPGNSSCIEREFFKALATRSKDKKIATFNDCQRIWRSSAQEHDYYQRPKHLLEQLGLDCKGILWAEIVACEKLKSTKESKPIREIPDATFKNCSNHSFAELLRRLETHLSEKTYFLCLGKIAFWHVSKLPEANRWRIVGVYHPTGSRRFGEYFIKDKDKDTRIVEQKLDNEKWMSLRKKIKNSDKPFFCEIALEGMNLNKKG